MEWKVLLLISYLLILQAYGLTKKPVVLPKCVGNEVLNKCFQGCFSQRCLTNDGPRPLCLPTKDCKPACVCPFNYRRNKQNVCIPTRECPPFKCKGKNQVYNSCPALCPGEKCADRKLKKCPYNIRMILNCNPACRCSPGFYRDANNNCISTAECDRIEKDQQEPNSSDIDSDIKDEDEDQNEDQDQDVDKNPVVILPKCSPDEVLNKCYTGCLNDRCPIRDGPRPLCLPRKDCKPKCVCRFNYRRNKQNVCVPTKLCPPFKCKGRNQVYKPCPALCPGEKCADRKLKKCPFNIKIVLNCNPACRCKPGFYRDANNNCISAAQCSVGSSCPRNEEYKCVMPCPPKTCRRVGYLCVRNQKCVKKCDCKDGFLRNTKGICVAINDCDKESVGSSCPRNEEYRCVIPCPPNTCFSRRARYLCVQNQKCVMKCDCKGGFLRNTKGICVAINDCDKEITPPKCPKNQEYKCVKPCPPKTCFARRARYRCKSDQKCTNKCDCKVGFLKNSQGTCVPIDQCKKKIPQKCPVNEIWNSCPAFCQMESCNSLMHRYACRPAYPFVCNPRCVCLDGYYRNKNNRCVPLSHCKKCVKNEVFACHRICPAKTCTSMVERKICPSDEECKYKCDCKDGFLRNKSGICIVSTQCYPSINPANSDSANPDLAGPDPADLDPADPDPRESDSGNWDPVDPNSANPDPQAPKLADPDPIPNQSGPDDDDDESDDDDEN